MVTLALWGGPRFLLGGRGWVPGCGTGAMGLALFNPAAASEQSDGSRVHRSAQTGRRYHRVSPMCPDV